MAASLDDDPTAAGVGAFEFVSVSEFVEVPSPASSPSFDVESDDDLPEELDTTAAASCCIWASVPEEFSPSLIVRSISVLLSISTTFKQIHESSMARS